MANRLPEQEWERIRLAAAVGGYEDRRLAVRTAVVWAFGDDRLYQMDAEFHAKVERAADLILSAWTEAGG